jgi:hypothetical protein
VLCGTEIFLVIGLMVNAAGSARCLHVNFYVSMSQGYGSLLLGSPVGFLKYVNM